MKSDLFIMFLICEVLLVLLYTHIYLWEEDEPLMVNKKFGFVHWEHVDTVVGITLSNTDMKLLFKRINKYFSLDLKSELNQYPLHKLPFNILAKKEISNLQQSVLQRRSRQALNTAWCSHLWIHLITNFLAN